MTFYCHIELLETLVQRWSSLLSRVAERNVCCLCWKIHFQRGKPTHHDETRFIGVLIVTFLGWPNPFFIVPGPGSWKCLVVNDTFLLSRLRRRATSKDTLATCHQQRETNRATRVSSFSPTKYNTTSHNFDHLSLQLHQANTASISPLRWDPFVQNYAAAAAASGTAIEVATLGYPW